MLKVDLTWCCSDRSRGRRSITIANMAGGQVADYSIQRLDGPALAVLRDYPRWSEPIHGLIARSLQIAQTELDVAVEAPIRAISCATFLVSRGVGCPRLLATLDVDPRGRGWTVSSAEGNASRVRRPLSSNARTPVALAVEALCLSVWNEAVLAPPPAPVDVPFRVHDGRHYIRMVDIPVHIRPSFARFARGMRTPEIPHERECFYAWNWISFVGPR